MEVIMNLLQFMKVDFRLTKKQLPFLVILPCLVVLIALSGTDMFFIVSYLCFGALILSTTPFMMEDKNMSSFVQLLPGTHRDRVAGRFFWFFVLLLAYVLFGFGISYFMYRFGIGEVRIAESEYFLCLAAALVCFVIGCIQIVVFYLLGRVKSQQFLNLLRMIPAFLFFFGMNYVTEQITDVQKGLYSILRFLQENRVMLLLAGVGVAACVFVCCIAVSTYFVSRRDIG